MATKDISKMGVEKERKKKKEKKNDKDDIGCLQEI
jgi:hypothetical protein